MKRFDGKNWMTSDEEVWYIVEHLTEIPHKSVLDRKQARGLRLADEIEMKAGEIVEYEKKGRVRKYNNVFID